MSGTTGIVDATNPAYGLKVNSDGSINTSGGGGGGGAVTVADGADVTQGTSTDTANANTVLGQLKQVKTNTAAGALEAGGHLAAIDAVQGAQADASATSDGGTFSLMALVKRLLAKFPAIGPQAKVSSLSVTFATDNPKAGVTAASGDFADGAITTIGTEADVAWSSGNGTVVALLKALFSKVQLVTRSALAAYSLASTTTSGSTQNSGDIAVGAYTEISLDINTTAQAGTAPTIQYFYERKGADGIYYVLWQSAVLTAATNTLSTSIGAGMAYNQSLGLTGRLRWAIGGSATPTFTHTANITGK